MDIVGIVQKRTGEKLPILFFCEKSAWVIAHEKTARAADPKIPGPKNVKKIH